MEICNSETLANELALMAKEINITRSDLVQIHVDTTATVIIQNPATTCMTSLPIVYIFPQKRYCIHVYYGNRMS